MRLSEERSGHLAHYLWDALRKEGFAQYDDPQKALMASKKYFRQFLDVLDSIDQRVRQKIDSLKRGVPEGSREWDVLYRQYSDEELQKLKF